MKTTFGERLEHILNKKGIPRRKFAKMLGVTDSSIGYYINDDVLPKSKRLFDIAEKLNVSLDYLCGLSDIDELEDEKFIEIIEDKRNYDLIKKAFAKEEDIILIKKLLENQLNYRILKILIDLNEEVKKNVVQMLESLRN